MTFGSTKQNPSTDNIAESLIMPGNPRIDLIITLQSNMIGISYTVSLYPSALTSYVTLSSTTNHMQFVD